MTTTIVPPGYRPRGLAIIRPEPPTPPPTPATAYQDREDLAVTYGFRLWQYVTLVVVSTLGLAAIAWRIGRGVDLWVPFSLCAVVWGISFAGLLDYARRGART